MLTAAIIDDVLGLIILGVVSGIVSSFESGAAGAGQMTLELDCPYNGKSFRFSRRFNISWAGFIAPKNFRVFRPGRQ